MNSSAANRQLNRHRQYRAWLHSPPPLATIKEERSFRTTRKPVTLFEEVMQQHRDLKTSVGSEKGVESTPNDEHSDRNGDLHEISLE